jgi:hypothetical protein
VGRFLGGGSGQRWVRKVEAPRFLADGGEHVEEGGRRLGAIPGANEPGSGEALLESGGSDLEQLKAALAKWSRVEQASKPGTARWFRATYGLAKTELSLGQKSRARARIKLTQASHPDLGGAEQKAEFLELLAECES